MTPSKKYWISNHEGIPVETKNILNEYLLSLKQENKDEEAVSKYRTLLEKFLSECSIPSNELKSEIVHTWLLVFSENQTPLTIDLMLSSLSSFFKFCLEEDYMDTMDINNQSIPDSLPGYLNEQEYTSAKIATEEFRDRALLLFLLSTGCRLSEISNLKLENVNLDKRTAKLEGKSKKIRHVHFSKECSMFLREYLQTRTGKDSGYLFLNTSEEKLSLQSIYRTTKKLGKMENVL